MAFAVHHERVPASGVEHCVAIRLVRDEAAWPPSRGRLVCHAVLARENVLRVMEVRQRADGACVLVQVGMHHLFGQVTGLHAVRTLASQIDGRDRLLISFRDAKVSLMEWDDVYHDPTAISLHTFERAPPLAQGLPPTFVPHTMVDQASRCAALLLPHDTLAIVPLVQDVTELGADDPKDIPLLEQVPYMPSFVLSFRDDIDEHIHNVRDCVFLPGFQNSTLAVLYESQLTWTGSLTQARRTMQVCFVTLDLTVTKYPVTVTSDALPYDALYLVACPESLGGVLVVTPSSLMHLDQTARMVGVSVNGWTDQTTPDIGLRRATELSADLDLQESVLVFTDAHRALLSLRSGRMYTVECAVEGRTVTRLVLGEVHVPERRGGAACMQMLSSSLVLCASMQDDTYLYVMEDQRAPQAPIVPAAPLGDDEELDLYGSADPTPPAPTQAVHLHVHDTLPTLAPLNDVAHGLACDAQGRTRPLMVGALQHGLVVLEPRLSCFKERTLVPARSVWIALRQALLFAQSDDDDKACAVYKLDTLSLVAEHPHDTLACGTVGDYAVRVTTQGIQVLDEHAQMVREISSPCHRATLTETYMVLVGQEASVWTIDGTCVVQVACQCADVTSDMLVCVLPDGRLALHSLPGGACTWQSQASLTTLPALLSEHTASEDLVVAHIKWCKLTDVPVLLVQYTQGLLAMYEIRDTMSLVLVDAYMLRAPSTALVPLSLFGRSCIGVAGPHSLVIVRDRKGPPLWLETSMPFSSMCDHASGFVGVHEGEASVWTVPPLEVDAPVPYQRWATRTYTHVAIHEETGCLVASSAQPTQFVLYSEEEEPVRDPALDPSPTYSERGALELFARIGEPPIHGYEFESCETVTCIHMAPLDALDRRSGRRTFVTVGTVISHGEDRTAKGFMYVFDIVQVVSGALRLRLMCAEEMRAPVTTLHDLNGFLVACVGQKLLVRSWELGEWLVTVAFLDLGMYATSVQRVKNFLLVTDVQQGAYFCAFQEDPARLVLLGREYAPACLLQGAMLIDHKRLAMVTCDVGGCIRLLDYAPSNPTSLGGQRLLVRCEYHAPGDAVRALMLHGPRNANGERLTSEIVLAKSNGAIDVLVPVSAKIYPTLQLFQSQLVRTVPHMAGLHPRAFRTVAPLLTSRPLSKGILDGALLHTAESLPRAKLLSLVRDLSPRSTGGIHADDLLRCLVHLQSHW